MSDLPPADDWEGRSPLSGDSFRPRHAGWSVTRFLRHADFVAAVLLAMSTVLTAWCAYQATRWSGVQATAFAQASSLRINSNREYDRAIQLLSIDAATFMQWVSSYNSGNTALQKFYENNVMRPQFLPYLHEWVASDPLHNPNALRNPLVNTAYQHELVAKSEDLQAQADEKFVEATDANQTGDDYVLATVLFASVLFFAGISTKFEQMRIQATLVLLAFIMFVIGLIQVGGLPIQ